MLLWQARDFLLWCLSLNPSWQRGLFAGLPRKNIALRVNTRLITLHVRVADTFLRRAGGFQYATPEEIRQAPILIDFKKEVVPEMHMRNVCVPLDIAFIGAGGCLFSIVRAVPKSDARYRPRLPARYVLEAYEGFFGRQGISAGDTLLILDGV